MEKDWVKIYASNQQYLVSIVQALLKENDIESVEIDQKDSSYQVFGEMGLYVKNADVIRAKHIISKNENE